MDQNRSKYFWILLYPVAVFWSGLTFIRRLVCRTQGFRSKLPVLCVGNIHSGGSSKTPVVIEIAKYLKDKNPTVLSRGYRRQLNTPMEQLDPSKVRGVFLFGDEPWLIAKEARVPVWIGKNRGEVAALIEKKQSQGVLILDDGFQNFTLKKDLSLICIHTDKKLVKANTIPLGELRESLGALKSAQAVLLVRGHDDSSFWLWKQYMEEERGTVPVFVGTVSYSADPAIRSGKWIAFSGIAGPERFTQALKILHCNHELFVFRDHHIYTEVDAKNLELELKKHKAIGFVTTLKDYYKVIEVFRKVDQNLAVVKMEVKIEDRFWQFLSDRTKTW